MNAKMSRCHRFSIKQTLAACLILVVSSSLLAAQAPLGPAEGQTLLQLIRKTAMPAWQPAEATATQSLSALDNRTLMLALYRNGVEEFRCNTSAATLVQAAELAGKRLAAHLAARPDGEVAGAEGRLCVSVITKRTALKGLWGDVTAAGGSRKVRNRVLLGQKVAFGLDGVASRADGNAELFSPRDLLVQARKIDIIMAAYQWRKLAPPAQPLRIELIRTACFVEEKPGGKALPVRYGNVMAPTPNSLRMEDAYAAGGKWLLGAQREDGSFLLSYLPATATLDAGYAYNLLDHMRITYTLGQIYHLTGDERFRDAQFLAFGYVGQFRQVLRRQGASLLRSEEREEIAATALLLTSLCTHELKRARPVADSVIRSLGTYLCTLVDAQGWLYAKLEDAEAGNANAVRILRSETYAEVLLALCLLERVSPREQVRQATNRLLNRLATSPVTAVPPPTSRTIEALAQAYLLREDKRLGNITFELGVLLLKVQLTPSTAESPDLVGGFRERTLALHTLTAAQAVNAMSAAYAVGRSLKLRADFFGAPVRNGAHFLMTMQFREENSFYLPQGNVARGGFRKSVDDLILQTAPTAESVRALIAAAAVTAETIKSPPPGAPKKEAT